MGNYDLSPELQTRFDSLVARCQSETLSQEELRELIALTEQIETADAERIACLAESTSGIYHAHTHSRVN